MAVVGEATTRQLVLELFKSGTYLMHTDDAECDRLLYAALKKSADATLLAKAMDLNGLRKRIRAGIASVVDAQLEGLASVSDIPWIKSGKVSRFASVCARRSAVRVRIPFFHVPRPFASCFALLCLPPAPFFLRSI